MKRSGPERSKASSLVTCSQPSPSLPIRQLSGMKASLNVTSFQSWRPAGLEVDQDLAQPLVAIAVLARGAHQRDAVVVAMCTRGPHLGAVDPEAARHRLGAGAHRGEVRTGVRLAHADREVAF